jgi:hypothetical protein
MAYLATWTNNESPYCDLDDSTNRAEQEIDELVLGGRKCGWWRVNEKGDGQQGCRV